MRASHSLRWLSIVALAGLVGCSEPVQVGANPAAARPAGRPGPGPGAPRPGAPQLADAGAADAGVDAGPVGYTDDDFVEQDVINRDPFRDFVLTIQAQGVVTSRPNVKMRNVSLDQMHLIAIITGIPVPYAMIEDPEGIGHVVVRGDYIGRDEVVNAGGADGMPIALNWRVDRIRDGELVLTREDPLHPDQPPLMRSMAIRDVAMEEQYGPAPTGPAQLGNTGDGTAAAAGTQAPSPGMAPAPTPPAQPRGPAGTTYEPPQAPAPAPTAPSSSGGSTPSGSTSRFGGVFNRR